MSWLATPAFSVAGWAPAWPVLAWIVLLVAALGHFVPTCWWQWGAWRRNRAINGGTVALAALGQAVASTAAAVVCLLCLGAALLAAHRDPGAALFLLFIPVVKLAQAVVAARTHRALMCALEAWEH